jgi:hypothetical protein
LAMSTPMRVSDVRVAGRCDNENTKQAFPLSLS